VPSIRLTRLVTAASAALAISVAGAPITGAVAVAAGPTIVVEPGDTLSGIALRTGVPLKRLVQVNAIEDPNRIVIGQLLRLSAPAPAAPAAQRPAAARPATAAPARVHLVASGEHLTGIARHYGVTIAAIVAANGIANPSRIYAGQRLLIPSATPSAATAPAAASSTARIHVVAAGETLTSIARHYGVTIAAIVAANGIANPSRIYAGQRLTIGSAGKASAPTTAARASRPPIPPAMAAIMAERDHARRVIAEEAARFDVPAALALAVAWQESGWRQKVVSHVGAIGIMQLLPTTADWVGQAMLGAPVNVLDLRSNARAGVRLLRHYLDRYGGNWDLALAAYYQGQTAVDRHGVYPVSRPYIASIKALAVLFGG
jgi:LysM repeat protein